MRKTLIIIASLIAVIFGTGYVIGQIRGATPSSAASPQSGNSQNGNSFFGHNSRNGFFRGNGSFRGSRSFGGPMAFGKVTGISGGTITISPTSGGFRQSTVTTVDVTSSTTYSAGYGTSSSLSAIKTGTYISAQGTASSDGKTLTATSIRILSGAPGSGGFGFGHGSGQNNGPPGGGFSAPFSGPRATGEVTAINGDTFTIKPGFGRFGNTGGTAVTSVVVNGSTKYLGMQGATESESDIKTGSLIIATGTVSSDGKTLTASQVVVLTGIPGMNNPGKPGKGKSI